ncbi:zinc-dependent alcohol dehydrogenase [Pelagicoccus mobilis]|uniref:Zinc-binding alcohol dehydrogenase n=1 Tax=Pelagicoccus mobilis TaxID=415221 RepID=A0A934RSQ5_9BACT|nr:zinc-binding alcohol dehydrogenase [Pelagicoccus mobilis]MBK1876880.1 zinc-binding alcohol dehydrogenase [Pelagicoccus mobilis]
MKGRALVAVDINRVEIADIGIQEPGEKEALVRTTYSTISPGTELRVLNGSQPGLPAHPVVLGYSAAGVVERAGPNSSWKKGDRVQFCGTQKTDANSMWGGHAEFATVDDGDLTKVPDTVDLRQASATKLIAIALHGFKLNRPTSGENIVVIGLGPIGMLSALIHKTSPANILALDLSPSRVELARSLGINAICVKGTSLESALLETYPNGADSIVDSTGSAAVFPEAIKLGRVPDWGADTAGSRFVIQGSPMSLQFPYVDAFERETTFLLPRDNSKSDLADSLDLLGSGQLSVDKLIGSPYDPEEAQSVYDRLISRDESLITGTFKWS